MGGRRPLLRERRPGVDSRSRLAPSREKERSKARAERRPLLVIDGDSLAHRFYHALPKTIRRDGGRPVGVALTVTTFGALAAARWLDSTRGSR